MAEFAFKHQRVFEYGLRGRVTACAWDPSERLLAVGTSMGELYVAGGMHVDHYFTTAAATEESSAPVRRILFCSGRRAVTAQMGDTALVTWDLHSRRTASTLSVPDGVSALCGLPGAELLAVGTHGGLVHFFNAATGARSRTAVREFADAREGAVAALAFHPTDVDLLLIALQSGRIAVRNVLTNADHALFDPIPSGPALTCASWRPDGMFLAAGYSDGYFAVFDVYNRRPAPKVCASSLELSAGKGNAREREKLPPITDLRWVASARNVRDGSSTVVYAGGGAEPGLTLLTFARGNANFARPNSHGFCRLPTAELADSPLGALGNASPFANGQSDVPALLLGGSSERPKSAIAVLDMERIGFPVRELVLPGARIAWRGRLLGWHPAVADDGFGRLMAISAAAAAAQPKEGLELSPELGGVEGSPFPLTRDLLLGCDSGSSDRPALQLWANEPRGRSGLTALPGLRVDLLQALDAAERGVPHPPVSVAAVQFDPAARFCIVALNTDMRGIVTFFQIAAAEDQSDAERQEETAGPVTERAEHSIADCMPPPSKGGSAFRLRKVLRFVRGINVAAVRYSLDLDLLCVGDALGLFRVIDLGGGDEIFRDELALDTRAPVVPLLGKSGSQLSLGSLLSNTSVNSNNSGGGESENNAQSAELEDFVSLETTHSVLFATCFLGLPRARAKGRASSALRETHVMAAASTCGKYSFYALDLAASPPAITRVSTLQPKSKRPPVHWAIYDAGFAVLELAAGRPLAATGSQECSASASPFDAIERTETDTAAVPVTQRPPRLQTDSLSTQLAAQAQLQPEQEPATPRSAVSKKKKARIKSFASKLLFGQSSKASASSSGSVGNNIGSSESVDEPLSPDLDEPDHDFAASSEENLGDERAANGREDPILPAIPEQSSVPERQQRTPQAHNKTADAPLQYLLLVASDHAVMYTHCGREKIAKVHFAREAGKFAAAQASSEAVGASTITIAGQKFLAVVFADCSARVYTLPALVNASKGAIVPATVQHGDRINAATIAEDGRVMAQHESGVLSQFTILSQSISNPFNFPHCQPTLYAPGAVLPPAPPFTLRTSWIFGNGKEANFETAVERMHTALFTTPPRSASLPHVGSAAASAATDLAQFSRQQAMYEKFKEERRLRKELGLNAAASNQDERPGENSAALDTKNKLEERGEQLNKIETQLSGINNAASEFLANVQRLNASQAKKKWYQI